MKQFREHILRFILKYEKPLKRLFYFLLTFLMLYTVSDRYDYFGTLSILWILIAISLICAFLPMGASALICLVFITIELFSVSFWLSLCFVILVLFFFFVSIAFNGKRAIHMALIPVAHIYYMPYLSVLYEGYFGSAKVITSLVGGGVISFFLRSVRMGAGAFKNEEAIEALGMLFKDMFSNPLLYTFCISIVAFFMCIRYISRLRVRYAWVIAVFTAAAVEFLLMLSGYLLTNSISQIPYLVIANVSAIVLGLVISFLFEDIKVNAVKELEFEDEEYIYRVVAVPKIRVEKSTQKIRRITRSKRVIEAEEIALRDKSDGQEGKDS